MANTNAAIAAKRKSRSSRKKTSISATRKTGSRISSAIPAVMICVLDNAAG
jgi:hypothetical protein